MEGTRISHYEIARMLGRGGMGEVYEAVDVDLGRRVALKFVAPELAADAASLRRFEQEAASAARLSHPHIARVYAFHRDTRPPFIDMELVPGGSLRSRIEAGPLPVAEALGFARDVASALAHAHRKDIVHRDIKPENLMFGEEGEIKVMDFGLARALHASRLTMTGAAVGTAAYMAPESIQGTVGPPADVFALGVVLHEMLAGALPFAGDNPFALMYSIANTEPRRVREARPDVPEAAEALILRLLAKDPAARPEAVEAARELGLLTGAAPVADSGVLEPTVVRLPAGETPASMAATEALMPVPGELLAPAPPRRAGPSRAVRWGMAAGVVAVLAVATSAGVGFVQQRRSAATREARHLSDEGLVLFLRQSYDSAAVLLEQAVSRDPGFAPALINLGRVWHERGVDTRAESLYSAALARAPRDPRTRAYALGAMADLDMAAGAWPAAVGNLERAFALDSSGAKAYNDLGFALVRAGRALDARGLLERGVTRFPDVAPLHKNLALADLALGDAAAARDAAERALVLQPTLPGALAARARARVRLGDRAGAAADLEACLASDALDPRERDETLRDLAARGVTPAAR